MTRIVRARFVVERNYAGWRLDAYLQQKIRRLDAAKAAFLIAERLDTEDGRSVSPETLVEPGLAFSLWREAEPEPETPMAFGVVFDDGELLVIDKPAGLPIHPTARYFEHTFTALAKARFPGRKVDPAHRIDRETSGLVACGCAPSFTTRLKRAFADGRVEKVYLALCAGWPAQDSFTVDAPLALTLQSEVRVRMHVHAAGAQSATAFEVLGRRLAPDGARVALLGCHPRTGRQHQIRAHLHHAGLPLVGDKIYGSDELIFDRFTRKALTDADRATLRLDRQALHAWKLTLPHPRSGAIVTLESPLAPDLQAFWDGCREAPVAMLSPPIEPFRPSQAGYAALAGLLGRAWAENPTCAAWLARWDAQRDPAKPLRREVVRAPDDPARLTALVEWSVHAMVADPGRFQLSVAVDPAHGRRGLGTGLLRRALAALPADRPIRVECETTEDRPWAVRLLERHGFRQTLRCPSSELDLAGFDPGAFEEVARRVEARGLRLRSLGQDGVRDERLLRGLHALQSAVVADVPGVDAAMGVPFEVWRAAYRDNPDLLPEGQLLALDGEAVVGMTLLWASQATDRLLYTGFTGVARSHRRLGLATALKVRSLAWARGLRTAEGRHLVVRTSNAEINPMLGINLRLGFVELPARLRFELRRPDRA